jgi:hypothetical protein
VLWRVADIEKISSSEYAIDGNLSRFTGMLDVELPPLEPTFKG